MKRLLNKQLLISTAVCFIPMLISAVFYSRLPDPMPIHWSSNGMPDNYAPKWVASFIAPFIFIIVNIIVHISIDNDPKRENVNGAMAAIGKWAVPVLGVVTQSIAIAYCMNNSIDVGTVVSLLVGVIVIIIGNYLPKCRQNYTVGIRLPWTLSNEENWRKTHRMSGYLWIICGTVMIVNVFLNQIWLLLTIVCLMIIIPAVYSLSLYMAMKRGSSNGL